RVRPPAGQLAGVVQLDLLGDAEVLPALPEEPEDLVHAARVGQAQADGPVEDILAHPEVMPLGAALEGDRPDQIDLVRFVASPGLRARPRLARQQRGEAYPRRGQTVALEHAFDGALTGERADAQDFQLGQDGGGADQAVPGRWGGVGLEPAPDSE